MTRLPRTTGRELIAALERAGYVTARVRGSHHFLRHPDGRTTIVPTHAGEIIGPGLMRKILRDCDLTAEQVEALL
jgi:predicted RNA binding protein YcfA (HicA-like mRNA interferase family)